VKLNSKSASWKFYIKFDSNSSKKKNYIQFNVESECTKHVSVKTNSADYLQSFEPLHEPSICSTNSKLYHSTCHMWTLHQSHPIKQWFTNASSNQNRLNKICLTVRNKKKKKTKKKNQTLTLSHIHLSSWKCLSSQKDTEQN
jgi:hypothetical protein